MKRRDWKIKKLRKNSYGKYLKRRVKLYFLRELLIRKHNFLLKKDLITNFCLYRKLLFNLNNKKLYINNMYFNNNLFNTFNFFYPAFLFNKKIFGKFFIFKDLIKNNKLEYIFIKKKHSSNFNLFNNNVIIYNKQNKLLDTNFLLDEVNKNILFFKYSKEVNYINKAGNFSELSFFINYNIYFFNLLELYKIIIIIYIYKTQ